MIKPYCQICDNKMKDNLYIYLEGEQKLVHQSCQQLKKDVVVNADSIKFGIKAGGDRHG